MNELQNALIRYFSDPSVFADVLNVHLHKGVRIFLPENSTSTRPPIFCGREGNRFLLFQNDLSMNYAEEGMLRTRYLLDFCLCPKPAMMKYMIPEEAVVLPESFPKRSGHSTEPLSGPIIRLLFYAGKPLTNNRMRNGFLSGQAGLQCIQSRFMTYGILYPEEAEDEWFDHCDSDYRFIGRILKYRDEKEIIDSLVKTFINADPKESSVRFLRSFFDVTDVNPSADPASNEMLSHYRNIHHLMAGF